jgi:hypothetical protein
MLGNVGVRAPVSLDVERIALDDAEAELPESGALLLE